MDGATKISEDASADSGLRALGFLLGGCPTSGHHSLPHRSMQCAHHRCCAIEKQGKSQHNNEMRANPDMVIRCVADLVGKLVDVVLCGGQNQRGGEGEEQHPHETKPASNSTNSIGQKEGWATAHPALKVVIACAVMASRLRVVVSVLLSLGLGCAHKTDATTPPPPMRTSPPAAATVDSKPTTGATKTVAGKQTGEISKKPLPLGPCEGRYTDEARRTGVEGTVILDIVVGEDGLVRDVTIVQDLAAGLGEAAVRSLKSCRFTPGERDGKPVAVHVPRFRVIFSLRDGK